MLLAVERSPCAETTDESDNTDRASWTRESMVERGFGVRGEKGRIGGGRDGATMGPR